MIRSAWVGIMIALATLLFGLVAIVASLLRVRGPVYFWATQQWSRVILWASDVSIRTHGMDRVDWSRPLVLVSNHTSFYDVFALAGILPTPYAFVAKKELERIPFFGTAWKAAGHISIDRSNRASALQSLRRAAESIHERRTTVIMFPEGTRSLTGELLPFKKGAFNLSIEAKVPVLPAVVTGSSRIQSSGSLRIHPGVIDVYFGEPMEPSRYGQGGPEGLVAAVRGRMEEMLAAAASHPTGLRS